MVNGDSKSKQIYKINRKFLNFIKLFQKQAIKLKCKNWTLMQKSNEKEKEKTGAGC